MAYPYDGMFYPTLPEDTQDFPAVLSGVGRSLREIGRSTQYLPYDVLGAPVDIATLVARPFGYQTQTPVGGSDWLIDLARQYGIADKPTGSGTETLTRLAVGVPSPVAVPRAIGAFAQGLERASDITTEQANRAADALVRAVTGNPQATAPQVLQETAMPFMQAVAPRPSGLLETPVKSDLGFYSALEQATIPLQNKGTGSQFLAQIEKTAGVKPEEVKWTGLDEFLKSRQNVTKQEVQEFLDKNRVEIKEVALSNETATYSGELPKFSSYTLPGGENYREILLTLPQKGGDEVKIAEQNMYVLAKQTADLMEEWKGLSEQMPGDPRVVNLYQQLAETRRMRDQAVVDARELRKASEAETYRSSHFDQPNILAHMRVNDRVVDGKKTLFIEEVQSDWHQAGRKKGYADKDKPWELFDPTDAKIYGRYATEAEARAAKAALPEERGYFDIGKSEGVPDAPFKTTWHELSLKRAIQEASEKGYDQIAFTTGKTQAERYDLSKQVDSLLYTKNPNGTYRVSAQVQGQGRMLGESIPESDLADYVGKEVAEKMAKGTGNRTEVAGQYDPVSMTSSRRYMTELSGEGLKVGGEGMKGFYDQILPKSLEKLGKKFDAKVGKTFIEGERTRDASGIPSMYPEKIEVWKMDITPKMRESVLTKGQPLFAATPAGLGLLGSEEE